MIKHTLAALALGMAVPLAAHAGYTTDFSGFTTGSIDGQDGWTATGSWDEEIVDIGGDLKWRVSNAVTAGSFGNMPFTPAFAPLAGESGSGATANVFVAEFQFEAATGAAQPDLALTISPDTGTGVRMSYLNITDDGSGLAVGFYDYDMTRPDMGGSFPGFHFTELATGLDYSAAHTLKIAVFTADGPAKVPGDDPIAPNDVVMIWVNGVLAHTGSSWEQYYPENQPGNEGPHAFSQLLFRISGDAAPANADQGLLIDNIDILTAAVADAAGFRELVNPVVVDDPAVAAPVVDARPVPALGPLSLGLLSLLLLWVVGRRSGQ